MTDGGLRPATEKTPVDAAAAEKTPVDAAEADASTRAGFERRKP